MVKINGWTAAGVTGLCATVIPIFDKYPVGTAWAVGVLAICGVVFLAYTWMKGRQ
jgi:hypothetical protein